MLLRDRLLLRMREMGATPDYTALAADVLGIRNAPAALARRLVSQALVVEDRQQSWRQAGERIVAQAPTGPGVYTLRDDEGRVLYVGKAVDVRRRLRTHFAPRRWRGLKTPLARVARAEWEPVGSELEALLREAVLIHELRPLVNVQVGRPDLGTRAIPARLVTDTIVVLPSVDVRSAEMVAACVDGRARQVRALRSGRGLATQAAALRAWFEAGPAAADGPARASGMPGEREADDGPGLLLAPLVFSWLAGRGRTASRVDPRACASGKDLTAKLRRLLRDEGLFTERIEVR